MTDTDRDIETVRKCLTDGIYRAGAHAALDRTQADRERLRFDVERFRTANDEQDRELARLRAVVEELRTVINDFPTRGANRLLDELERLREEKEANRADFEKMLAENGRLRESEEALKGIVNREAVIVSDQADELERLREDYHKALRAAARYQDENALLRGNLKGNPVTSTIDGIAKMQARLHRIEEAARAVVFEDVSGFPEIEALRTALYDDPYADPFHGDRNNDEEES